MSIPPDFTHRVQENPQIAVELYEALVTLASGRHYHLASSGDPDTCKACLNNFRSEVHYRTGESHFTDLKRAREVIAKATDIAHVHAHYATELALDAAARTGEEPLPEHIRCVPGME